MGLSRTETSVYIKPLLFNNDYVVKIPIEFSQFFIDLILFLKSNSDP